MMISVEEFNIKVNAKISLFFNLNLEKMSTDKQKIVFSS